MPAVRRLIGMAAKPQIVESAEKLKASADRIKDSAVSTERSIAHIETGIWFGRAPS